MKIRETYHFVYISQYKFSFVILDFQPRTFMT